ncbi:MAG: CDP-glycerol glycerophosphotransferase family protein [Spirochaetes bacterium]|nr:CDP-glycerol glycerophosphotransferase family protein [Brevinematales bacterium]MCL1960065.1 CDP-glycerol glycerophosphotransferase family protein [Spirochaetota bacterium]
MIHFYPLYIDPGTGSAMFSILIGAAATIYFLGRALIIKLKVFFSGGKASNTVSADHSFVIYNEGKQYWNVFKPVLEEFENRKVALLYFTSAKDDPVFDTSWSFIKPEYIGEGNRAFARLNMLRAKICLMTTPGLDVYQLKRSKMVRHYAHVLHEVGDAMYRLFGIDYFDSILLTGDYQAEDIRTLERKRGLPEKILLTVGCSYLDVYAEKIKNLPPEENHSFTVLVSPSWGASALLTRYGEKLLDPLSESGWRVIIRPHPQSKKSETAMLERLQTRYKNLNNIEWDFERENIISLSKADIMISDFSGIIFDYMFLRDKPVLYVNHDFDLRPYDADDIDHELWKFKTVKETGIELREEDFPRITEIIKNAGDSESLKNARKKARETAWQYPGEAGKRVFDFMMKIVNG